MNKKQILKAAALAAVVCMPAVAGAADAAEQMKAAAVEMGKLETGIEAIGAIMIGLVVTIKGYAVGKRMINRV